MNKIKKIIGAFVALIALVILASCGEVNFKGSLELTATTNKITAKATFDKSSQLEESKTVVTVKLYNDDVTSQLNKQTVDLGTEKVEGSVEFESLDMDTKYVLKLYVSYNGNEYLVDTKDITTSSKGSSKDNPISIKTVDDFLNMENEADSFYRLDEDLDFTGKAAVSLFTASEPFKGSLDGNNKTIKNYSVALGEYSGLFEYLKDATIKDLKLENVLIDLTSTCKYVGALAGYAVNSDIENVSVNGFTVTTSSGATTTTQIGGLVGYATSEASADDELNETKILNCNVNDLSMTLEQVRPTSSYVYYIGGFVGRATGKTTITGCYTQGVMELSLKSSSGKLYAGGFIGGAESEKLISNCYSLVTLALVRNTSTLGYLACGGFAGDSAQGQANLSDCLAVADIIVLSEATFKESTAYSVAQKAYIGGVIGKVSYSSDGVNNCYYAKMNYGIQVFQTDTYKSDCFVSNTIAYVNQATKNKIANVYTYDDALNVKGMSTESTEATYISSAADTTKTTVLGDNNKEVLTSALDLRQELNDTYVKFSDNDYFYTGLYTEATTLDLASANLNSLKLAGSTVALTVENSTVTVTPTSTETYDTLYISLKNTKIALTTLVKIGSKLAA